MKTLYEDIKKKLMEMPEVERVSNPFVTITIKSKDDKTVEEIRKLMDGIPFIILFEGSLLK